MVPAAGALMLRAKSPAVVPGATSRSRPAVWMFEPAAALIWTTALVAAGAEESAVSVSTAPLPAATVG